MMFAFGNPALRTRRSPALTARRLAIAAAGGHHGMVDLRTACRGLLLRPHCRRLRCRGERTCQSQPGQNAWPQPSRRLSYRRQRKVWDHVSNHSRCPLL